MTDDEVKTIAVVAIDPHPIMRSGIEFLVSHQPHMRFVGGAATFQEGLALIESTKPTVAIVNLPLPIESGFSQISEMRKRYPALGLVVFTTLEESVYAERCFRAGANAFLSKRSPAENILTAVERAAKGELFCSEALKATLLKRAATGAAKYGANPAQSLSNAESHVFEMIGEGMTTHQIAEALRVSAKTIETYRTRLKQKLGLNSGAQLAHFAITYMMGRTYPYDNSFKMETAESGALTEANEARAPWKMSREGAGSGGLC